MPAGMFTSTRFALEVLPLPWHFGHGDLMIFPLPPQRVQGCELCITPKGVRCCTVT